MTAKVKKTIIRLLLTYLAVLIIPILISVFVFRSAYQVIETSIKATTAASLQQAGIALEQRVSEIETMTYELYQNNELIRFGINTSGMKGETPSKLLELQNNLPNYSVSNKFILDYFILFPNSEIVLNNKIAYTYENFFQYYLNYDNIDLDTWRHWSDQDNYPKILPNQPIQMLDKTASTIMEPSDIQEHSVITFLMKSGKSYSTRMYIMILVDSQEFYNLVRSNLHTDSDYLRIMDTQGNFLYEAGAEEIYHQYELLDNLQKEDSFYHLSEQQDLFVSNHYSQALGWNILSIRPYGDVMANLNHINRNVRIFMILSFLIGIASAVLFTVRKNTPVMSLLLDNHTLQEKMEQQKPFLLNTFLERLLMGRLKEPEIQQIASYLQFPMLSNYQCAVIHFFDMQQGLEQLEQVKLVFSNMLEKNMDAPCYCHDIGSDKLACIFGGGTAFSGKNAAQSWADLVHQSGLKGRCKIAVSLSESCGQLNDIGIAAQEALHALDYKDWDQDFQLLHAEEYDSAIGIVQEKKDIQELIILLENCIQAGASAKTLYTFSAIRQMLVSRNNPREGYILVYTMLDFLEKQALDDNFAEALQELEQNIPQNSMADNLHHLGKICVSAAEAIGKALELRKQTVFDDMARYIEENYQNQNLSLSLLSEKFSISETYLSQQFKKHFGENLSSYIENIRMKHAEDLLLNSNFSINEIATQVGYNSANTFGKVFHKKYNVSPSVYRNSKKQN